MSMKTIAAAEFKARCLTVMEEVRKTRESVVITKRGVAVAKLVPAAKPSRNLIGRLRGVVKITGDIESPVVPPETWKLLR
jgi:prevent-host-death family protein